MEIPLFIHVIGWAFAILLCTYTLVYIGMGVILICDLASELVRDLTSELKKEVDHES